MTCALRSLVPSFLLVCALGCASGETSGPLYDDDEPADEEPAVPATEDPALRIFGSSAAYPADLVGFTGIGDPLAAADSLCQLHADAADLDGTFRAWLSTSSTDAIARIEGDLFVDLEGDVVFPNRASLAVGPSSAIDLDERGHGWSGMEIWTGTGPLGLRADETCASWTTDSEGLEGMIGWSQAYDTSWTADRVAACDVPRHLLCFEQ